jgi:hypothetical protein
MRKKDMLNENTKLEVFSFAERNIAPKPLDMFTIAYWNVTDLRDKAMGTSSILKAAALGTVLGSAAAGSALLARNVLKARQQRYTGAIGIVGASGNDVFLLELGDSPLNGDKITNLIIPKEVIEAIPRLTSVKKTFIVQPLDAKAEQGKLLVRYKNKSLEDSVGCGAFNSVEKKLEVNIGCEDVLGAFLSAEQAAEAIRKNLKYPAPSEVIKAIAEFALQPIAERVDLAFEDAEYVNEFFREIESKKKTEQHAIFSAAKDCPSEAIKHQVVHFLTNKSRFGKLGNLALFAFGSLGVGFGFVALFLCIFSSPNLSDKVWGAFCIVLFGGMGGLMLTASISHPLWCKRELNIFLNSSPNSITPKK